MKKRILRLLTVLITAVVLICALNVNASAVIINKDTEVDFRDLEMGYVVRAGAEICCYFSSAHDINFHTQFDGDTLSGLANIVTVRLGQPYIVEEDFLVVETRIREIDVYILPRSTVKLDPKGGKFSDNTTGYKTIVNVQETPDNTLLSSSLIPTRTGYTFKGWYTGDYSEQVYSAGGVSVGLSSYWSSAGGVWKGAGDKDFVAKWQANTYSVSFDANGGSVSTTSQTVTYDSAYGTLPTPTRTGYTFAGWYTAASSGTQVTESAKVQTASNHTLYAHWTPNTYGVTLNTNGGTINSGNVTSYTYSTTTTLPSNVTKTGYTFGGWYDNSSFSGSAVISIGTTAMGAKTYYAKWTPNTYTITFDAQGGTTTLNSLSVIYGSDQNNKLDTNLNPTKAGYTFDGWFDAPTGGNQVYKMSNGSCMKGAYWTNPWDVNGTGATWQYTNNVTLYAHWTVNKYTITWVVDGVTTTEEYDYGTTPSFKGSTDKAATDEYTYTFAGWDTTPATVTGNKTYTATYNSSLRTYGASVGESQHGSVTLAPTSALVGGEITAFITPNAGYAVDTVTVNGVPATKTAENQYTFAMPAADAVVDVTYKKIPYNVSLYGGGSATGGSYSVDAENATVGDTVTVTVASNLGYLIESVSVNGVAATNNGDGTYSFTMPAQEVTVSVAFDIDLPAIAKELQDLNDADADIREAFANGDVALANQITEKVNAAKTELANTIAGLETTLNGKIDNLQNQITANDDDITNIIKDIGDINDLIDLLETADVTLGGQITEKVNAAKSELANTITGLETTLNGKIDDLQNQIAANDGDITNIIEDIGDINDLIDLLETADVTLGGQISDAIRKAELELAAVKERLEELIGNVQSDLDTTKAKLDKAIDDLNKAITDGDKDLSDKIAALNTALTNAKAALETADKDNKAELVKKIEDADASLQAAIDKVASDLTKAQKDLADAIATGDALLNSRISSVSASLRAAKAALEKADSDNKAALEAKIEATEATLDAAIKAVQKNLDDAKEELNKAIADGDTELDGKITALGEALATAKAALEATDSANKSELTTKIDEADAALQTAINALSNELNATNEKVAELETFIIIVCVISGVAFCGCGTLAVFYIIDKKKNI